MKEKSKSGSGSVPLPAPAKGTESNSSRNPRKARADRHKAERDATAPVPGRLDFNLAMDDCGRTIRNDEGGVNVHGWENRGAAVSNYRENPNEFLRDLYLWQNNTNHPRYGYVYGKYYGRKRYPYSCPHCEEAWAVWCPAHVRQAILLEWREVVKEMTRGWTHPLEMQDYGDIFASALKRFQRSPNLLGELLGHE